ncbi:MAG: PTS fructose transporter subunit IIA [Lachnospiraceae bacterium]|nr:PTS fructose transporter subunit IIA [Lachnospiraceae bacterium]
MRHYVLASHAYLSKGFTSALELIIGRQQHLKYYCAYVDETEAGQEHFKDVLLHDLDALPPQDEVIVMTDMFGGSVNNELMELIRRKNTHLVTGVNLALVIGILTGDEEEPADQLIPRMVEEARGAMLYCNEMDLEEADPIDDF